jgi:hypothetical protein
LGALVSKVTALSKLTLDMTRLCIEVNGMSIVRSLRFPKLTC